MRHPVEATVCVWATLVAYRCSVLLLPRFSDELSAAPVVTVALALASDVGIFVALGVLISFVPRKLSWVLALSLAALLAMHLRVVDYFGWSLRPEHLALLQTPTSVRGGWAFLVQSKLPLMMLVAAGLLTSAFWIAFRRVTWPKVRKRLVVPFALAFAVLMQWLTLLVGAREHLSSELTLQPLAKIPLNFVDYALANPDLQPPSASELAELRSAFSPSRPFAEASPAYPLWQRSVWQGHPGRDDDEDLRAALHAWLKEEAQRLGPWNVVVVQQESLRAHELQAFADGNVGTSAFASLTPGLNRILREGVRFTNVLATGDMTHYGELATACSLYATPFHNILLNAPSTRLTCLSDAFATNGYETTFGVGTDPRVNSRASFYPLHQTLKFWAEPSFAPDLPRQGWGVTDAAFLQAMLERIGASQTPFYAHLLTLSKHAPIETPVDLPRDRAVGSDRRAHMLSYVDWAFTRFYEALRARHPHTVVVFTADHPEWPDDGFPTRDTSGPMLTKLHRIPLALLIPNLPDALKGRVVARLGSDADLAPTLLNLLSMTDVPNAFMGEDLFRRSEPVVVKWGEAWLDVRDGSTGIEANAWSRRKRLIWGALGKSALLMPRAAVAQGGRP